MCILLLVDDSRTLRKLVRRELERSDLELEAILEAESATNALDVLAQNPDVSLVLSDVNMPGASGFELVRALRRRSASRDLPIVLLTTEREELAMREVDELIQGFLRKPVEARELSLVLAPLLAPPEGERAA